MKLYMYTFIALVLTSQSYVISFMPLSIKTLQIDSAEGQLTHLIKTSKYYNKYYKHAPKKTIKDAEKHYPAAITELIKKYPASALEAYQSEPPYGELADYNLLIEDIIKNAKDKPATFKAIAQWATDIDLPFLQEIVESTQELSLAESLRPENYQWEKGHQIELRAYLEEPTSFDTFGFTMIDDPDHETNKPKQHEQQPGWLEWATGGYFSW